MKKTIAILLMLVMAISVLTACAQTAAPAATEACCRSNRRRPKKSLSR
jgi:hypothetical protein